VEAVKARFEIEQRIDHFGVLRPYLTRHGIGPLPTHDASLDELIPELHNVSSGWQGSFRRGHPDGVLLRYALEAVGDLSGLLVSHMDVFDRDLQIKWCESYDFNSTTGTRSTIEKLALSRRECLDHQAELTALLLKVRPNYASGCLKTAAAFEGQLASITDHKVLLRSFSPSGDIKGELELPLA
jgi:adenylosuccinate synthase